MRCKRQWSIELLRFICILFVIYNHCDIYSYGFTTSGVGFIFYGACSCLCKIAVPCFFAISGALLLGKNEEISFIIRKRIAKYIIILVIFSAIMYLVNNIRGLSEISVNDFLEKIVTGGIYLPYWFLYRYIVFLICLPFLRMIAQNMKKEHLFYVLTIYLIFNCLCKTLPLLIKDFAIYNWQFNIDGWIYVYIHPLIGYYIFNRITDEEINKKDLGLLFLAAIASVAIELILTWFNGIKNGQMTEEYFSSWNILTIIFTLYLTRYIQKFSIPVKLTNVILWLGKVSFGVYLLENILERICLPLREWMNNYINYTVNAWIYMVLIYLLGGAVVSLYYFALEKSKRKNK